MRFVTTDDPAQVGHDLAERIKVLLGENKRVLLLLSGGSAVAVAVGMAKQLQNTPLGGLAVTLTDERYGVPGHADSNWQQLMSAGFSLPGAVLIPVLQGKNMPETATMYGAALETAFEHADYRIGLFGIGSDGHTAGILPQTEAVTAPGLAVSYDGGQYQRVTMTGRAIARLDEAMVYAMGESKWPVLEQLQSDVPVGQQPAQFLKQVAKVTVYNDHQGDIA